MLRCGLLAPISLPAACSQPMSPVEVPILEFRDAWARATAETVPCPRAVRTSCSMEIGGPFTLTGADGKPFASSQLAGKPFAIFGFTHCPDACPTMLARLAKLRRITS